MKKTFLLLVLLVSAGVFSQSAESLKAAAKKYYQANYLMDFEAIASYSYPKMAETIGNDILLENIEKHYENEAFRLRFQLEIVPFQFGEIKKIEGHSFCVISCRNPIRYTYDNKLTPEAAAQTASVLKQTLKTSEVVFEPARNSFNVKKTTVFVAISDETTSGQWKFFNLDDLAQDAAFRKIFGESTQKELGL